VGCDGRVSASILSARSRISGEYFLFIVFHPYLKNGTKVRPIQFKAQRRRARSSRFGWRSSTTPTNRMPTSLAFSINWPPKAD
ncbi:hypothetical protein, partial [Microbacterium sp. zg.Y1084]|uniref:hypothetical protein n=1 Tax=Microbacterium sp. zg.Y1084 TaxID=2969667 RepID=UPI00214CCE38